MTTIRQKKQGTALSSDERPPASPERLQPLPYVIDGTAAGLRNRSPGRVALVPDERTRIMRGSRVGRLVRWCDKSGPIVDYPGNDYGELIARSTVDLDAHSGRAAAAQKREVLLVFEADRADRPIIVGLLTPYPRTTPSAEPSPSAVPEVTVDGRRVVIVGQDEIVLRCGKASITLRRNGRVVVRGTYVESRSQGVNRIKGGSVQVN